MKSVYEMHPRVRETVLPGSIVGKDRRVIARDEMVYV